MPTIDIIPNGLTDLPQNAGTRFDCADCGTELSLRAQSSFCEVRRFDGSVPVNHPERTVLIGHVCLACADKRDAADLATARQTHGTWRGYIDETITCVQGVRSICDGKGTDHMLIQHVGTPKRLPSGDTMTPVRAVDKTGQRWYGRARSLGYGRAYVTLRPMKPSRAGLPRGWLNALKSIEQGPPGPGYALDPHTGKWVPPRNAGTK